MLRDGDDGQPSGGAVGRALHWDGPEDQAVYVVGGFGVLCVVNRSYLKRIAVLRFFPTFCFAMNNALQVGPVNTFQ